MKLEDLRKEYSLLLKIRDSEIQLIECEHNPKINALKFQIDRMTKQETKAMRRAAKNMR